MRDPALGKEITERLIQMGLIPPYCRRFMLTAEVGKAIELTFEVYDTDSRLGPKASENKCKPANLISES